MEGERGKIWGREQEYKFLETQLTKPWSATLIHGEPQIGKSTLVRGLRQRLREQPKTDKCVGLYKAIATQHDPYVFAVADLLSDIYSRRNFRRRLQIIQKNLRNKFTHEKLGEACNALWAALMEIPQIKPLAKLADWLKSEIRELDLQMRPPSLSTHQVERILAAILEACPDTRLVLIIDDYSAAYEMRGKSLAPAWDHATLLHLLDHKVEGLHLILTWKETAETAEALQMLNNHFRAHLGEVYRLGRLDDAVIWEWGKEELPELAAACGQDKLVALAEGLPKVPAELQARKIFDPKEAAAMAYEVKLGSYGYIHEILKESPKISREILMQMAVIGEPVHSRVLCSITGLGEDVIIHSLKSAAEQNLVYQRLPGVFWFEHDVKQQIVLQHLGKFYWPKPYLEKAFVFFESHIGPYSTSMLSSRLNSIRVVRLLSHLAEIDDSYQLVFEFYQQFLPWHFQPDMRTELMTDPCFASRPSNVRAILHSATFAQTVSDSVEATYNLEALLKILESDPAGSISAWISANGLKLAIVRFFELQDHSTIPKIVDRLYKLAKDESANDKVVLECIGGLANYTGFLRTRSEHPSWEDDDSEELEYGMYPPLDFDPRELRFILHDLSELVRRYGDDSEILEQYAHCLVNAGKAIEAIGDWYWLSEIYDEIGAITSTQRMTGPLAEACGRGFYDTGVSVGLSGKVDWLEDVIRKLREFALKHEEAMVWYVRCLYNSTHYFAEFGKPEKAYEALDTLAKLGKARPRDAEVLLAYTKALRNTILTTSNSGDWDRLKEALHHFHVLFQRHPDNEEVAVQYSQGLYIAFNMVRDKGDKAWLRKIVETHNSLAHKWKHNESITSESINMLADATFLSPDLIDEEWNRDIERRIVAVVRERDTSLEILQGCSRGLANMVGVAGFAGKWQWVDQLIQYLHEIMENNTQTPQFRSDLARALYLAYTIANHSKQKKLARKYKHECLQLGDEAVAVFREFEKRMNGTKKGHTAL